MRIIAFMISVSLSLGSFAFSNSATEPPDSTDATISIYYYPKRAGSFELGVRNTYSFFSHAEESVGEGVGGQFRIGLFDRVNSEWFFDYIKTNISDVGKRVDYHIGWSIMYYPWQPKKGWQPYIVAGHCFDLTKISALENPYFEYSADATRWSGAIQGGVGIHRYLTDYFDISLSAQYMQHLGTPLGYEILGSGLGRMLYISEHEHTNENHLLLNISANYKIGQLWGSKY
jgi:hypothetical protein